MAAYLIVSAVKDEMGVFGSTRSSVGAHISNRLRPLEVDTTPKTSGRL